MYVDTNFKLSLVQHYWNIFKKRGEKQVVNLINVPKALSGPSTSHVGEASKIPWRSNTAVLLSDGGLFFDPVILSSRKIYPSRVIMS